MRGELQQASGAELAREVKSEARGTFAALFSAPLGAGSASGQGRKQFRIGYLKFERKRREPDSDYNVASSWRRARWYSNNFELASRWFRRNQPYYESNQGLPTACLDRFEAVELPYFFCYGIKRPLLWEFPR